MPWHIFIQLNPVMSNLPLGDEEADQLHRPLEVLGIERRNIETDPDINVPNGTTCRIAADPFYTELPVHIRVISSIQEYKSSDEPTETESKQTLDDFVDAMQTIAEEAKQTPERLHTAPHNTPVGRLDEVHAARQLKLSEDG